MLAKYNTVSLVIKSGTRSSAGSISIWFSEQYSMILSSQHTHWTILVQGKRDIIINYIRDDKMREKEYFVIKSASIIYIIIARMIILHSLPILMTFSFLKKLDMLACRMI